MQLLDKLRKSKDVKLIIRSVTTNGKIRTIHTRKGTIGKYRSFLNLTKKVLNLEHTKGTVSVVTLKYLPTKQKKG